MSWRPGDYLNPLAGGNTRNGRIYGVARIWEDAYDAGVAGVLECIKTKCSQCQALNEGSKFLCGQCRQELEGEK